MRQIRTKDVPRCERKRYKERCIAEHNRQYFLAPIHAEALRMDRLWMEKNRPKLVAPRSLGRRRTSHYISVVLAETLFGN